MSLVISPECVYVLHPLYFSCLNDVLSFKLRALMIKEDWSPKKIQTIYLFIICLSILIHPWDTYWPITDSSLSILSCGMWVLWEKSSFHSISIIFSPHNLWWPFNKWHLHNWLTTNLCNLQWRGFQLLGCWVTSNI